MGVAKPKKHVIKPSNAGIKPQDEVFKQQKIVPCIKLLHSKSADEVLNGLQTASELITDSHARQLLLREKLLHHLLNELLQSTQIEVLSASLSVLRDVVQFEGRDPALFLTRRKLQTRLDAIVAFVRTQTPSTKETGLSQLLQNLFSLCRVIVTCIPFEDLEVAKLAVDVCSEYECSTINVYEEAVGMLYLMTADSENLAQAFNVSQLNRLKTLNSKAINVYILGIAFNQLTAREEEDNTEIAEIVKELSKAIQQSETDNVETALEILAIAAQTDDLELLNLMKLEVFEQVYNMLTTNDETVLLNSVGVLNNIGWSFNQLEMDWSSEADAIASKLFEKCLTLETDVRFIAAGLGLLAACVKQNQLIVQKYNFNVFALGLMQRIEALYKQPNSDPEDNGTWTELGVALINVLNVNCKATVSAGLIPCSRRLILSLLEHSKSVEAEISALNALFELFCDNEAEYNEAEYNKSGLREAIESLKPQLKRSLKSSVEQKEQAREAAINLENFIQYKRR